MRKTGFARRNRSLTPLTEVRENMAVFSTRATVVNLGEYATPLMQVRAVLDNRRDK